jgi:hypothetical protein
MPIPTSAPVRKVSAGGVTGAFVTLIVFILNNYVPFFVHKPISGEISAAATTVLSFIAAYLVPPAPGETTVTDQTGAVRSATQ